MNEEYFTFRLQYKHSEERFLTPKKKSENVRPHSSNSIENATPLYIYSQSRGENTTPSGGASPLASYKEVPPPRYPASRGFSLVFLSVVLPFSSRFWLLAFCFGCEPA